MTRAAADNAQRVDAWLRSLSRRRQFGTATPIDFQLVKFKEILDPIAGWARVETGAGDEILVNFGLFDNFTVDDHYPMYQTEREMWIKAFGLTPAAPSVFIRRRTYVPTFVDSRSGGSLDLELRIAQSARGLSLGVPHMPGPPSFSGMRIEVRDGAFVNLIRDNVDISGDYEGPAAGDLSAATYSVAFDDIYLAAGAAIYRNQRGGNVWRLKGSAPFAVFALAPDVAKAETIYAASETGEVARSVDAGATWASMGTVPITGAALLSFGCVGTNQLVASSFDDTLTRPKVPNPTDTPDPTTALSHFRWHVSTDGGGTWGSEIQLDDYTAVANETPGVQVQPFPIFAEGAGAADDLSELGPYAGNTGNPENGLAYLPFCGNYQFWFNAWEAGTYGHFLVPPSLTPYPREPQYFYITHGDVSSPLVGVSTFDPDNWCLVVSEFTGTPVTDHHRVYEFHCFPPEIRAAKFHFEA